MSKGKKKPTYNIVGGMTFDQVISSLEKQAPLSEAQLQKIDAQVKQFGIDGGVVLGFPKRKP